MAELSRKPMGGDTSDATMVAADLANGKTGYANGVKITGIHVPNVVAFSTSQNSPIALDSNKSYAIYIDGWDSSSSRVYCLAKLINGSITKLSDPAAAFSLSFSNNNLNWSVSNRIGIFAYELS